MALPFQIRPRYEKEWRHFYKRLTQGRIDDLQTILNGGKIGAACAQEYLRMQGLTPTKRLANVSDVRRRVRRVGQYLAKQVTGHDLRRAYRNWLEGYFQYKVRDYEAAWATYEQAYAVLSNNPDFLLDFGRLAYNTGGLDRAEELFERAHSLRMRIPAHREPLQTYRWRAKTYRLSAEWAKEVACLEQLQKEVEAFKGRHLGAMAQDVRKSEHFVLTRRGRAYLDLGEPGTAWAHIERSLDRLTPEDQVLLAQQGVQALMQLGRHDEAEAFASSWANRLGEPAPLARFLRLADRPFSARRAYLRSAEEAAEKPPGSSANPAAKIYFDPHSGRSEIVAPPPGATAFWLYAEQAFDEGLPEEGLDLALRAAGLALEHEAPLFLASVMQTLHRLRSTLPDAGRISDLFEEAAAAFPDEAFIQLQVGYHVLDTAAPERAVVQLERACALADQHPRMQGDRSQYAFLAIAYARCGDEDRAIALLEDTLPQCDPDFALGVYRRALEWALEAGDLELALDWTDDFLRVVGGYGVTMEDARPVLELAVRAALSLGELDNAAALGEQLIINAAHYITPAQEDIDSASLRAFARPLCMGAVAHALAGNTPKAEERLRLARQFDPSHELVSVAQAALSLQKNDPASAARALVEGSPPDWLLAALGPSVAEAAEGAGSTADELEALRLNISKASGTLPSIENLTEQTRQTSRSLEEARQQAEAAQRANDALKASFDELLADIADENERLRSTAEEARQAVVDAENQLVVERARAAQSGRSGPSAVADEAERFRALFSHVTFVGETLDRVLALRGSSFKSVARTLGIIQHDPDNLAIRKHTVDIGARGTAYEVGFPGNGNDPGRLYFTGGGTRWTLEAVGYKSTQPRDIAALKRGR